ncbi:MAG TPA: cohesin domain-containing protein [Candidatus Paceibacterota bacterium]
MAKTKKAFFIVFLASTFLSPGSTQAEIVPGASLYFAPSVGTYIVGDTFTVSLYVNTASQAVNAIEAKITFPPDKLQVVSPSTGKSVIGIWIGQPEYSNQTGTVHIQGAIPNPGLNVKEGLVSTITFRAKSAGQASIKISDSSKVLLNDGQGTDVLTDTSGAIIDLILPPPQGPVTVSATHPDQTKWYPSNAVTISWLDDDRVDAYSYILDENPLTVPDNVPEGSDGGVSFDNASDGLHYFHIKARRFGVWGGVTHYIVRIDNTPPADFKISIEPGLQTSQTRPIIEFNTTDQESGISFYEVKVIGLSASLDSTADQQPFFTESGSPYVPTLEPGKYKVIVRAHDVAGNVRDVESELLIYTPAFGFLGLITPNLLWSILLLACFVGVGLYFYRSSRTAVSKESSVNM